MKPAAAEGVREVRNDTSNRSVTVALIGNPNSGKTTLFNALTGLRQKVGNYPGVTVEKKTGRLPLGDGGEALLVDLPGLYSLTPHSPDESIAREVLMGLRDDIARPDVILSVVDASNLERNLYLTSQVLDLGIPVIIVLTLVDAAEKGGIRIDSGHLQSALGVPVCPVVAPRRQGIDELIEELASVDDLRVPEPQWHVAEPLAPAIADLQARLAAECGLPSRIAFSLAVSLLMEESAASVRAAVPERIRADARVVRDRLNAAGVDAATLTTEARYSWIHRVCEGVKRAIPEKQPPTATLTDRVDRIVMHPVFGYVLFLFVMAVVFQSIFTWVQAPMDALRTAVDSLGEALARRLPPGDLADLLHGGVLGGVGNTIVFLPQILLLFFFVSLLEDTGYMARAAFLMDRLMSKVGLHGKSFIPLLSSFACAIPGIMATRTIGDRKARLISILVAPLMSCSARLPVYALMIGAFVPNRPLIKVGRFSVLTLPGATLLAMYLLGMVAAFCIAGLFHRTLLKGVSPTFVMELPPYRVPSVRTAVFQMFERAALFLKRAGTVILAVSVVLWGLSTYPKRPDLPPSERMAHSFVGYMGRALEPAIAPLGFDWKMGIGIVASFAAREVFVTAMGTVYNVDDAESDNGRLDLRAKMRADVDPHSGRPVFTPLVAICLMVYYVLAMQCMSTLAVVRRETNGWKWPVFQFAYMSVLAWVVTFLVYQGGRLLALG